MEAALASRPGRIDQAIEFPLPDPEGRAKLICLYSRGIDVSDDLVDKVVKRTKNLQLLGAAQRIGEQSGEGI